MTGFSDMLRSLGSILFYILEPPIVTNMEPLATQLKTNGRRTDSENPHVPR